MTTEPEPESAPPKLFLLQLAGESGVGKSTLARRIAACTGAAILDLDVIKSAALDAGAGWEQASRITHEALRALAGSLLAQHINVILDSPCRFEQIVAKGMAIAKENEATYCFIDCVMPDKQELARRIRARARLRSQMVDYGISSPDAPPNATRAALVKEQGQAFFDSKTPPTPWLRIDTQHDPESCLSSALAYLTQRRAQSGEYARSKVNHKPKKKFLLQMAGESGAGKSTLASHIAATTQAVLLDMDLIKSAALDAGATWQQAGRVSYQTVAALADDLLAQNFSVVLDSPCRFEQIVTRGMAIAKEHEATYRFIECVMPDQQELARRIRARARLRSQMVDYGVSSPDAPKGASIADLRRTESPDAFTTKYPPTDWHQIDTSHPMHHCQKSALTYLQNSLE